MAKLNDKKIKQFQNFFGVGANKGAKQGQPKIAPLKKDIENPDKIVMEKFPSHVQELFKEFMSRTYARLDSWEHRKELNKDMFEMYLNDSIISYAIDLVCYEVLGSVENRGNSVTVEAKRALRKDIMELFDNIDLKNELPIIVKNVVLTGNSGCVLDLDEKGVSGISLIESDDIVDRIEFNASEVKKQTSRGNTTISQLKNIQRSDMMLSAITDKENSSSFYKKYLLGFQIGGLLLPPWRFIHFRTETAFSAFKPFGTPMYIHALAPSKQFQYAMTLMGVARGLSFPVNKYTLTVAEKSHPTDKLAATIELMNELQNSGMGTVKKEQEGLGQTVYTVEGLYNFEMIESPIDLGNTGDVEMLREDRFIATHIPRDLIDPSDSGFGDTGVALKEKFKPFGNLIFDIQTAILQGIDLIVKIHLIQSGKYDNVNNLDYSLSLPFPRVLQNDDLISQKGDLLGLANDVIDTFSDKLLAGEPLPPDIAMEIYKEFFPVDDTFLEDLYKKMIKLQVNTSDTKEEIEESEKKAYRLIEKNIGKSQSKLNETISEISINARNEYLRNGVMTDKHYFNSSNKNLDFDTNQLNEWRITMAKDVYKKALREKKEKYSEVDEVAYKFESEDPKEEYGVNDIKQDSEYGIEN